MEAEKSNTEIILDTNFLVDLFRFNISFDDVKILVEGDSSFVIFRQILRELEKMNVKYAKVALKIVNIYGINVIDTPGSNADDAILSYVSGKKKQGTLKNVVLATNDSRLRKKAREVGTRVIYLRARKHLEISN